MIYNVIILSNAKVSFAFKAEKNRGIVTLPL